MAMPTWHAWIGRKRHWWRVQIRDALELVFIPALAVALPWPLCFMVLRGLAKLPFFYRIPVRRGLEQAEMRGWMLPHQRQQWAQDLRLVRMVDHADFYLCATRQSTWLKKYVQLDGQWPAPGQAGLLSTFHWGAGMWALRHAREQGLQPHMMLARFDPQHFSDQPVLLRYGQARTAGVAREAGHDTIDPLHSREAIQMAFKQKQQIMAVMDVPSDTVRSTHAVEFLGQPIAMPSGLLRMAAENQIPVTLFSMGIDMKTGRRQLRIRTLPVIEDLPLLMGTVFNEMDMLVRQTPTHWHFWSEAERIFAKIHST
jgi:hypothetical protein